MLFRRTKGVSVERADAREHTLITPHAQQLALMRVHASCERSCARAHVRTHSPILALACDRTGIGDLEPELHHRHRHHGSLAPPPKVRVFCTTHCIFTTHTASWLSGPCTNRTCSSYYTSCITTPSMITTHSILLHIIYLLNIVY